MSDHTSALVPIESWCYMSPELRRRGQLIDIGLFAEALLYYDRVFVVPPNRKAFAQFVSWFVKQGKYGDLIGLIKDGVVSFYYYSFITTAVLDEQRHEYMIWNLQDEKAPNASMFELQCLATNNLKQVLPSVRQRARLHQAVEGRVVEAKADDFGAPVDNARRDCHDPGRSTLLVQAFLDEIYPMLGLDKPPQIRATVVEQPGKAHITWNVDLYQVGQALGKDLNFHLGSPLIGGACSNRLLWSAAELNCDLYVHSPMSRLIGDKLYESGERLARTQEIIEQLEAEVEFPAIRQLVNDERIGLGAVLQLRRKGHRFRRWLQDESDRDRNALIAYHHEVAKESGWVEGGRRALNLFGVLGSAAVGAGIGAAVAGIPGAVTGAVVGEGVKYVVDLASKLNQDWRPVVFGNWARDRIRELLSRSRDK